METQYYSKGIPLRNIQVTDRFFKRCIDTVRKEVIPYQWSALNDEVEGAPPSFCMRNFRIAAAAEKRRREEGREAVPVFPADEFQPLPEEGGPLEDRFYGFVFQDTDFSKWIEAVGYSLAQHPDKELEQLADRAIDVVCAAQCEDGYLDTYYSINDLSKRFTNLKDFHELYCFGHLTEGAIAYYEGTGKDKLLKAARRFADYIASVFGPEEGKCKGYPGHEIAEMALGKLYEVTGEEKYLDLARFFIDERGKRPYYFDWEHLIKRAEEKEDYHYYQAHRPVREQTGAVGHAVRAVYLYTGMAQVAKYTGDESLKKACERLWESIEREKMYITGGIGATPEGEAFSYPFHLPNDRMYNETCASIGLVFFARRMLEMSPEARYADVMERALYNGIPSGMSLDGKSFFYVNPMEAEPEGCRLDPQRRHVALPRQKWFGCACCPPNLSRMMSSVAQYAYSENESTLFMHLYCGGILKKQCGDVEAQLEVKSEYPWKDKVEVCVEAESPVRFTFAIRIPGWCRDFSVRINGEQSEGIERKGYWYLERVWQKGDRVEISLPMEPVLYQADARVREDIGKAVLMRGPLVYCVEEADNGANLDLLEINAKGTFRLREEKGELGDIVTISGEGRRIKPRPMEKLYEPYREVSYEPVLIRYIPYYTWCNRGVGEMKTYLRCYES